MSYAVYSPIDNERSRAEEINKMITKVYAFNGYMTIDVREFLVRCIGIEFRVIQLPSEVACILTTPLDLDNPRDKQVLSAIAGHVANGSSYELISQGRLFIKGAAVTFSESAWYKGALKSILTDQEVCAQIKEVLGVEEVQ